MSERGVIQHRDRARQLVSFADLRVGNTITPTDIDGLIEYHAKAFFFFELKHTDAALPYGQQLALERLCDAVAIVKPLTALVIARHAIPVEEDVDASKCIVERIRFQGKWHATRTSPTLRSVVDWWCMKVDEEW